MGNGLSAIVAMEAWRLVAYAAIVLGVGAGLGGILVGCMTACKTTCVSCEYRDYQARHWKKELEESQKKESKV